MRLAVYTDYVYVREGSSIYAERAFSLFLARLTDHVAELVLIGRMSPTSGAARYALPAEAKFVALPFYESLAEPLAVARAAVVSMRRFWRALDDVDAVWLLGPHPLAAVAAMLALARRRRVILGVRSDLPVYARRRHPGRSAIQLAAVILDKTWRLLSRRCPTVVVGPELRKQYSSSPELLEMTVSLVEPDDIVSSDEAHARDYSGELTLLSVGRLAEEKNPLALAAVLDRVRELTGARWRLVVCGEGPLAQPLERELAARGLQDCSELRGYVEAGAMPAVYRASSFLLHTSWTEGLPQVFLEAFAAGLPIVSTDVGGIREAVGPAVALVAAGDVEAASRNLIELTEDRQRREGFVDRGLSEVRARTIDVEVARLAEFMGSVPR